MNFYVLKAEMDRIRIPNTELAEHWILSPGTAEIKSSGCWKVGKDISEFSNDTEIFLDLKQVTLKIHTWTNLSKGVFVLCLDAGI